MDRYLVRGRYGIPPAALASYLWELWRRLFPQGEISEFVQQIHNTSIQILHEIANVFQHA